MTVLRSVYYASDTVTGLDFLPNLILQLGRAESQRQLTLSDGNENRQCRCVLATGERNDVVDVGPRVRKWRRYLARSTHREILV